MKNRFDIGSFVKVKLINLPGHIRTPGYVRGKIGRIRTIKISQKIIRYAFRE